MALFYPFNVRFEKVIPVSTTLAIMVQELDINNISSVDKQFDLSRIIALLLDERMKRKLLKMQKTMNSINQTKIALLYLESSPREETRHHYMPTTIPIQSNSQHKQFARVAPRAWIKPRTQRRNHRRTSR